MIIPFHSDLCMKTQLDSQKVKQQIVEYFKTQPVLRAWLFGSFARDEATEDSDVDILFEPDMSQRFSLFTLGGMYMDLKELLGREVDLVPEGSLLPFAQETAEIDKVLIYERAN
jgi:predicted nucleotidyltransferase